MADPYQHPAAAARGPAFTYGPAGGYGASQDARRVPFDPRQSAGPGYGGGSAGGAGDRRYGPPGDPRVDQQRYDGPRFDSRGDPRFDPRFEAPRFEAPRFEAPRFEAPRFDPRFEAPRDRHYEGRGDPNHAPPRVPAGYEMRAYPEVSPATRTHSHDRPYAGGYGRELDGGDYTQGRRSPVRFAEQLPSPESSLPPPRGSYAPYPGAYPPYESTSGVNGKNM